MNKRHYEHTLPNIRGSLSNTYGQSGLKAAFVLLVTVPERPHFYTPSYSTRRVRRRPLIFPCKVKAVGNRQGAASFVVNNHQLASSSILVQHK